VAQRHTQPATDRQAWRNATRNLQLTDERGGTISCYFPKNVKEIQKKVLYLCLKEKRN
jgi:hypothetical protein